jgi:hypothetical protein
MRIIVPFLLFITTQTNAQKSAHAVDSLKSFSYFIFGTNGGYFNRSSGTIAHFVNGTCFFAKVDNRLFLISAKHVLTPFNPIDSTFDPFYPDTLYVKVKSAVSNQDTLWNIYIKPLVISAKMDLYFRKPDVFIVELKDDKHFKVNSLELYLEPNIFDSTIQKTAYIFGYPSISSPTFEDLMALPPSLAKMELTTKFETVLDIGHGNYDMLNFRGKIVDGVFLGGFSGSPIFIKETKGEYWLFGGLVSAYNPNNNTGIFVKPNEVLRELGSFFKQQ